MSHVPIKLITRSNETWETSGYKGAALFFLLLLLKSEGNGGYETSLNLLNGGTRYKFLPFLFEIYGSAYPPLSLFFFVYMFYVIFPPFALIYTITGFVHNWTIHLLLILRMHELGRSPQYVYRVEFAIRLLYCKILDEIER